MGLFKPGLAQVLNSLRSRKKPDHNVAKFSYELNVRHSRFISYLFTIHSQGLLHFTPHEIHFNYDSRNSFLSNHDSQNTKNRITVARKYPCTPSSLDSSSARPGFIKTCLYLTTALWMQLVKTRIKPF